jgi:putative membrane protein
MDPDPAAGTPPSSPPDPRVLFAAERTLLAWVRTGIAMMGFGFVVARFGLFLRELAAARDHAPAAPAARPGGVSLGVGTALVVLGVLVNAGAALKHWRTIRRLARGQPIRPRPISLETVVAVLLALLGLGMAVYLLSVR